MLYAGIVFIYLLLNIAAAWLLTGKAFFPKTWNYEKTYAEEIEQQHFSEEFYISLPKEDFMLDSPQGYKLHGIWIPYQESTKTAVIVHGHTYTLFGSVKYLDIFRKRGYNVLVYDQPYHGKSSGRLCSLGYREKEDLETMIGWTRRKTKEITGQESTRIITHGESMGAATVLLHAGNFKGVDAVIADCSFRSLRAEFLYQLRAFYKLPGILLVPIAGIITRLRIGIPLGKISPEKAVPGISAPVFFIHGVSDNYIPMNHSIKMYNLKTGRKRLFLMPDARHASSYSADPKRYEAEVADFLKDLVE